MEIVTGPAPVSGPFIPANARAVLGVIGAVSPEPLPIILFPGYEYHISEWHDEQGQQHWVLERRVAASSNRLLKQEPAAPGDVVT